jgi:hypothetical protein
MWHGADEFRLQIAQSAFTTQFAPDGGPALDAAIPGRT